MIEAAWSSSEVAERWRKGAETRNRLMAEVTARMLDEAAIRPGMRVLELGAGTGDVAMQLSERVGPGGSVMATDSSFAMVDSASGAMRAAAVTNVTLRVCDATALDFADASFDAVVARQVLMFLDLDAALPGVLRVMRAGARFGAIVWGPTANNPFHGIVLDAARAGGGWGDAKPEVVQAFSRGDAAVYEKALVKAGFQDVRVQVVQAMRTFKTVADAVAVIRESPIHCAPIMKVHETKRASAWKRVEGELAGLERGGVVEVPVEWLVLGAGKK
jgi:ubiquinone/menaquinone biosynthesis C-methylase UbiE